MAELMLRVQNVKCNGCVTAIQTGLADLAGVEQVLVEKLQSNQGQVTVKGTFSSDAVTTKLSELGYPVL
ncbi:heavy-metal-associated domain-containing protein [Thioflexithrix psekupsensis]|uniref:HMA domain-containing protein n=1 Tax=Thioflexithrix psekupsensis TaxID=1570016 RepID=A0A251X7C9_9GAMM|nr:heavy metal-associated domain-containing protein [Thioflexithrix psekupsensis]OUD13968.1 hypothetical protein TPSD3_06385 [Thioflexithrix psekupsensis]